LYPIRNPDGRAGMTANAAKLSAEELERLLSSEFPRVFHPETGLAIVKVWDRGAAVRQGFHPRTLRPGGTISGASMMLLTDVTMYVAVLAAVGWVPGAVTTNLNINFLSKPPPRAPADQARPPARGRGNRYPVRGRRGPRRPRHVDLCHSSQGLSRLADGKIQPNS